MGLGSRVFGDSGFPHMLVGMGWESASDFPGMNCTNCTDIINQMELNELHEFNRTQLHSTELHQTELLSSLYLHCSLCIPASSPSSPHLSFPISFPLIPSPLDQSRPVLSVTGL